MSVENAPLKVILVGAGQISKSAAGFGASKKGAREIRDHIDDSIEIGDRELVLA